MQDFVISIAQAGLQAVGIKKSYMALSHNEKTKFLSFV